MLNRPLAAEVGRYAVTKPIVRLPADYSIIVSRGVAVLWRLGAQLRRKAEHNPREPQLWLAVRDIEGLARRLGDTDEWEWNHGFADHWLTGQDIGVLNELLPASSNTARPIPLRFTEEELRFLTELRDFVRRYCDGDFEFDDPAA